MAQSSIQHLHIDPFSGVAGDMFLGALVDLGADPAAVQAALEPLDLSPAWRLSTQRVERHGIGAVDLKVEVDDAPGHEHAHSHSHDTPTPTITRTPTITPTTNTSATPRSSA